MTFLWYLIIVFTIFLLVVILHHFWKKWRFKRSYKLQMEAIDLTVDDITDEEEEELLDLTTQEDMYDNSDIELNEH